MAVPELTLVGLLGDTHTSEVEPLIHASLIVTGNHVTIGNIVAETIGGL